MNNLKDKRQQNGITLIALIITIIVLLILAGVALSTLTGNGSIVENANKTVEKYNEEVGKEQEIVNTVKEYLDTYTYKNVWDGSVNIPKTVEGMIPVYYDETSNTWKKADTTNKDSQKKWYSYTKEEKQWANVVTVESKNLGKYINAEVGTTVAQNEITAMFVWIPRYSYNIVSEGKIDISFLRGTSNEEADGKPTTKTVHPVFTDGSKNNYAQGGWDEELTGYWVAKFEASGVENGNPVGNGSASQYNQTQAPTENTYVRVLPNVISWRYNTIGEAQYRSMQMSSNTTAYGWTNGAVDSHLIKNDEWGGVAYLCYSEYGEVPMTNCCGVYSSTTGGRYDYYTGAGPNIDSNGNATESGTYAYSASHAYNTANGVLASTTGNVYGIYDMAGGNWERVAGYLNNGNVSLGDYGYSTTNTSVKYFAKDATKSTATYDWYDLVNASNNQKYWNKYEVSEEERTNAIKINATTTLTQNELWNANLKTSEYNAARLRITGVNYENMKKVKGIGIGEGISSSFSYYGAYNNGSSNTWNWFTDTAQPDNNKPTLATSWDRDYVLIGHARGPFVVRGGYYHDSASAGVLYTFITSGFASYNDGFRPAVVVPCT